MTKNAEWNRNLNPKLLQSPARQGRGRDFQSLCGFFFTKLLLPAFVHRHPWEGYKSSRKGRVVVTLNGAKKGLKYSSKGLSTNCTKILYEKVKKTASREACSNFLASLKKP